MPPVGTASLEMHRAVFLPCPSSLAVVKMANMHIIIRHISVLELHSKF